MAKHARIRRTWKKMTARRRKHISKRPEKPVKMYKAPYRSAYSNYL